MNHSSHPFHVLTWLAVTTLCLPPAAHGQERIPADGRRIAIRDVALAPGGLLTGQLLDANLRPAVDAEIAIYATSSAVGTTRTDASGIFAVRGLRGGIHQVVTPQGTAICRFWAPGTAPPCATDHLQIVAGQTIVRGQGPGRYTEEPMFSRLEAFATHPLVMGGLLAAAIAIPASLNNADRQPGS